MRPGCEPVRGWPLPGRGNQSICHRQTGWTQSGTGVFLGLKASQGPPLGGVAQALTHMGDWCGSVQTVRQLIQRNDGCANGTTPGRRRRPQGFPARHFPRERGAANRSEWRGATGRIRQSKGSYTPGVEKRDRSAQGPAGAVRNILLCQKSPLDASAEVFFT